MQKSADPQPTTTAPPPQANEEAKLLRRLQMMMNLVMQTIAQDGSLSIDEASQMIADSRKAALAMFPGKELAYDLIWRPRFQRLAAAHAHVYRTDSFGLTTFLLDRDGRIFTLTAASDP